MRPFRNGASRASRSPAPTDHWILVNRFHSGRADSVSPTKGGLISATYGRRRLASALHYLLRPSPRLFQPRKVGELKARR